MSRKPLVVLGMSGGVDSSVAVHLLQQAGYEVHGVHMLMIPEKWQTNLQAVADAKTVAKQFGIKFSVLDIREKFEQIVIQQNIIEVEHLIHVYSAINSLNSDYLQNMP